MMTLIDLSSLIRAISSSFKEANINALYKAFEIIIYDECKSLDKELIGIKKTFLLDYDYKCHLTIYSPYNQKDNVINTQKIDWVSNAVYMKMKEYFRESKLNVQLEKELEDLLGDKEVGYNPRVSIIDDIIYVCPWDFYQEEDKDDLIEAVYHLKCCTMQVSFCYYATSVIDIESFWQLSQQIEKYLEGKKL